MRSPVLSSLFMCEGFRDQSMVAENRWEALLIHHFGHFQSPYEINDEFQLILLHRTDFFG
jgi:hypothetical protein